MCLVFKRQGLRNLEGALDGFDLERRIGQNRMRNSKVHLELPKFKFESEIPLVEILKNLGMTKMFKPDANFKGISSIHLRVSDAVQKAVIEVDEIGTEAAAASAMVGLSKMRRPEVMVMTITPRAWLGHWHNIPTLRLKLL